MKSLKNFKNEFLETLDEGIQYSSDYKLSASGRKVRARRLKLSDDPPSSEISAVKEGLEESVIYSSDFKLSPSGRKIRARRFRISDDPNIVDDELELERQEKRDKETERELEKEKEQADKYNQKKDHTKEKKSKERNKQVKEDYEIYESSNKAPYRGMPPFTLVLKRKAIRQYPNDTRVALYWSDKLKTNFTVPYEDKGKISGVIQAESVDLKENVLDKLNQIVQDKKSMMIEFNSGHTKKIDHLTAFAITNVYGNLNEENKKKFSNMLEESPEHFSKATDFAFKNIK